MSNNNFRIIEQANNIKDVLRKGIDGFVRVSVDVSVGGDWDTHPIVVTVHSYDNHDIKHYIGIVAMSEQDEPLTDEQRWDAPLIKGIEMAEPDGPDRVKKAYRKIKSYLEKEGFSVYEHWKDFY